MPTALLLTNFLFPELLPIVRISHMLVTGHKHSVLLLGRNLPFVNALCITEKQISVLMIQAHTCPRNLPCEDAGAGVEQTDWGEPYVEAGVVAQAVEGAECNGRWKWAVGMFGRRRGAAAWHRPGSAIRGKKKRCFVRSPKTTHLETRYLSWRTCWGTLNWQEIIMMLLPKLIGNSWLWSINASECNPNLYWNRWCIQRKFWTAAALPRGRGLLGTVLQQHQRVWRLGST